MGMGAQAQQPAKLPRIGYLAGAADRENPTVEAFRQGLRDLGYIEGKTSMSNYATARQGQSLSRA